MKKIKNVLKLLTVSWIFLIISMPYSVADECAELQCSCSDGVDAAASEIDRILEDPDIESRGEFGVIRKDGEYVPYDWRIGLLKRFPKVSLGYLAWLNEDEDFRYGPGLYLTAYTRPDIKKHMFLEYSLPKSFELGVGNQVGVAKIGWLILPIIDLKFDVGVVARFEDNILENGISPMIGISLLRL